MLSKTINQKLPTVVYLMYVYLMKMAMKYTKSTYYDFRQQLSTRHFPCRSP